MRRTDLTLCAGVYLVATCGPLMSARADSTPVIVTYEQKKQHEAERAAARDPRGFWIRQIVKRLEDKKPGLPKGVKPPMIVHVTFVVQHDGDLASKVVSQSSGNELADKTAMAMLERAQPFPPMPAAMTDSELTFSLPVRFR